MRIRRRPRGGIENSSALSDMAFLLIIYFIVIAGFNINRGFLMNLPRKDSVQTVKRDELLRFSMDHRGGLLFRDRAVSLAEAEGEVRRALGARPNTALLLTIRPGAPWQSVVSFVELAKKNAVDSFSFRLENPENDEDGGGGASGAGGGSP